MQRTTNYEFYKPEYTDAADISYLNSNFDAIDGRLKIQSDAITSINDSLPEYEVYKVTLSSISSLPARYPATEGEMDDKITSDMICMNYYISAPQAQNGVWTITTYNGYLTVTGGANAHTGTSTNLTLYLMKSR